MEASPLLEAIGTGHQHHEPFLTRTEIADVRDNSPLRSCRGSHFPSMALGEDCSSLFQPSWSTL